MKLIQEKRILFLIVIFAVFGAVYFGFGNTPYTTTITYIYYALCLILSVLYIFVAGGLKRPPLLPSDGKKKIKRKKEKVLHPVKQREKFKRLKVKEEKGTVLKEKERELGPNILNIPEEKRPILCHILLLFAIPLYAIFLIDWFYLKFFV